MVTKMQMEYLIHVYMFSVYLSGDGGGGGDIQP